MTQIDSSPLAKAIEASLPNGLVWHREDLEYDTSFIVKSEGITPRRKLEIGLRSDGDVDIRFHLDGITGSPFEAHFIVHDQNLTDATDALMSFVEDLLKEQLVLSVRGGFFRAGSQFITPDDLSQSRENEFKVVASWSGTFDRGFSRQSRK
jgi:hypothetical protein